MRPCHTEARRSSLLTTCSRFSDQVKQQVEDLRFDRNHRRSAKQFAAIRIERVVLKKIVQLAIPSRRLWHADENSTASRAKKQGNRDGKVRPSESEPESRVTC